MGCKFAIAISTHVFPINFLISNFKLTFVAQNMSRYEDEAYKI